MMLKRVLLLSGFLCSLLGALAQSTAGITNIRDTSYNLQREYIKLKKDHPFIAVPKVIHPQSYRVKKDIVYCTVATRALKLDVFYPPASTKQKRTALLFVHGGGWRSGNKEQHHALAQRLAALGYVCFTPEYRLSTEALFPAAVHDLKSAVRWVRSQSGAFNIDPQKIAIGGFSAGGELAAFIGNTNNKTAYEGANCNTGISSAVQAILDLDGTLSFVHPESGEGDDSKRTSAASYWFGYSKAEAPQLWRDASPLTHTSPQTPPTLFINSSVARMHAGRDDYNKYLDTYGIYNEVKTFEGSPHSFPLFEPWIDSTAGRMDRFLKKVFSAQPASPKTLMVAQDGSGNYKTVQAAFNAIPYNNMRPVTVMIKPGIYKEKLYLDSTKQWVTIKGTDKFNTVLTYDDHSKGVGPFGDTINTFTSYSFYAGASRFRAVNVTFENTAGNTAGQAVAAHIMGDQVMFENCRFLGHQDVLYAGKPGTRQYFKGCYIEGTTDFIFGPSIALFDACHINSKRNSHVTAASTPKDQAFGYVFRDCVLTTDSINVNKVSLGRPWRPYASVTYLNCYLGAHIIPEGWNNWRNTENEKTARYSEYNSYGPGASKSTRFSWTRQLTSEEAKQITLKKVLGPWDPTNHMP